MDTTTTTSSTASRTYFRPTTASQRQLLFGTVAAGETVTAAARRAHVGRGTYYYWRERYATAGTAGLKDERSRAPRHPRLAPISAEVRAEVLAYYDAHPHERGSRTIADRLRQAHQGQSVIGHSKVAAIIRLARATPDAALPAVTGAAAGDEPGAAPTPPETVAGGAPGAAPTAAGPAAAVTGVAPMPPETIAGGAPGAAPTAAGPAAAVTGVAPMPPETIAGGAPGAAPTAAGPTAAVTGVAPMPPETIAGGAPGAAPTPSVTPAAVPVVHAPTPNQTANIDLCVVPLTHDGQQPWAAVSVSQAAAGATPEVVTPAAAPPTWPGQVFADPTRTYAEQMQGYEVQRTAKRAAKGQRQHRRRQKQTARQALAVRSDELRVARRRQRLARQREDATWRQQRAAHRTAVQQRRQQSRAERRASRKQWRQTTETWDNTRAARQQQGDRRTREDTIWRAQRQEIRSQLAALAAAPLVTLWLAILVVVDNGTRRCLQLPLFVTGAHVTAEEVIAQLRAHWPRELQFVISDNGPQFIADAFAQFAKEMTFLHIRIAPHRPQTNGIAERFVRTLKEWLAWHTWQSAEELAALLAEFIVYYNDRPHQGAELAGLSPNEFARQLGCSTC
jgi:transposase InsO family protein